MNVWIYDIETLKSCFTYTAINISNDDVVQYVIHKDLDERDKLMTHLSKCKGQIGFNNLSFDYPIIHDFICSYLVLSNVSADSLIKRLYKKAQDIINIKTTEEFFLHYLREKNHKIKQLDLYKIWHFDNKARRTSLKALEIAMNFSNVMEMEIEHTKENITIWEVHSILKYNLNDVLATYEFYKKSLSKIELRKQICKTYGLECINYSDTKIGEQLALLLYSNSVNTNPSVVKRLRTNRNEIYLSECIFDYINFESSIFVNFLQFLKKTIIIDTKKGLNEDIIFKNYLFSYGSGGIHQCYTSGVYQESEDYKIIDIDVTSLYPSIAVKNNLYPEHLGKQFCKIYSDILDQRIKAKGENNMIVSNALKLSLNSIYGKSNSEDSFLYDPKYTMTTTINGELLMTMLIEKVLINIQDLTLLQSNTDGITVLINKKEIDSLYNICREWEEITKLQLEYINYSKMIIKDVNNYFSVKLDGSIKYKGAFKSNKDLIQDEEWHKNFSFNIVKLAISEYFINNIPVKTTICNNDDIFNFCGRQKFTKDSHGEIHKIVYKNNNAYEEITRQQKNVRYYIKNKGDIFIKRYRKGSIEAINKGYSVQIFNIYEEKSIENYNINYNFYIKEAYKIIDILEPKQINLF